MGIGARRRDRAARGPLHLLRVTVTVRIRVGVRVGVGVRVRLGVRVRVRVRLTRPILAEQGIASVQSSPMVP